ncbi:PREDICTED: AP2-like ethylene-responsive transcription factor AIL6 isoform X2 [Tarenaya hassleriana]|uniref:AP2-like ethylene-responsive transcription factor AIL6 isoform X2 n=1 Tax=Tarenaya hassleriana TaxID=28532 RepID=UPI00053C6C78|nr:PREDICTED: AP2-like ethylene-responsive transcription factor AIL6 isoform X2 [Tarenaya hassleriana]
MCFDVFLLYSSFVCLLFAIMFHFLGWTNQKPRELFKEEEQITASMADSTILTTFADPQTHAHNPIPKLEDFLGDSSSIVRYSSDCQTETQDSSLTQIYDTHRHPAAAGFFSDHRAIAGFQTAFSANSGSEVDDSTSIGRTHLGAGEFIGHVVDSSGQELGFHGGGAFSREANNKARADPYSGGNDINGKTVAVNEKAVVAVETPDCSKKIADTFGQRTSIFRGVTRHRWTGRYEAHLWDNSCRREGQARKGRQVYLGGYDKEEKAARAYDLAALKYWGPTATTNFPISNYTKEMEEMKPLTKQEFIASLRRKSSGFSRGASIYRGVTRHHQQGRWQARIGRVAGNKDLYLGTFATEEEAAEAYDIAAIKFRGVNAVTNFEMSRYDVEAIMKSSLPIGGVAKRLKLSLESSEPKPTMGHHHHLQQQQFEPSPDHINFALATNSPIQTQIPCGIPFEAAALYHYHNPSLFQHLPISDSSGSNSTVQAPPMAPNPAEFFLWPNQSY